MHCSEVIAEVDFQHRIFEVYNNALSCFAPNTLDIGERFHVARSDNLTNLCSRIP